jgi:hypothetical protein
MGDVVDWANDEGKWARLVNRADQRGRHVPAEAMDMFIMSALADFGAAMQHFRARWGALKDGHASRAKHRMQQQQPVEAMAHILKHIVGFVEAADSARHHLGRLLADSGRGTVEEVRRATSTVGHRITAATRQMFGQVDEASAEQLVNRLFAASTLVELEDLMFDIATFRRELASSSKEGSDDADDELFARTMFETSEGGGGNQSMLSASALVGCVAPAADRGDRGALEVVRSALANVRADVVRAMSKDVPDALRRNATLRLMAIAGMVTVGVVCLASPALFGLGALACPFILLASKGIAEAVKLGRAADDATIGRMAVTDKFTVLFSIVNNLSIIEVMRDPATASASATASSAPRPWHRFILDSLTGRLTPSDLATFMMMALTSSFGHDRDRRDAEYLRCAYGLVKHHIEVMIRYHPVMPERADVTASFANARYGPFSPVPTSAIAEQYGRDAVGGEWSSENLRAVLADLRLTDISVLREYVRECELAIAGLERLVPAYVPPTVSRRASRPKPIAHVQRPPDASRPARVVSFDLPQTAAPTAAQTMPLRHSRQSRARTSRSQQPVQAIMAKLNIPFSVSARPLQPPAAGYKSRPRLPPWRQQVRDSIVAAPGGRSRAIVQYGASSSSHPSLKAWSIAM